MSNQGTIRLKVTNGAPAIEKLWNGRFKLEFFCDNNSPKEDWYHENVSALLPDYGILQTTNFGSGVSEDWEAIPASVYPDMRLVLAEYPYNVRAGKHYVKLTYETLTASWVEEKDEDADYELNGLKRVSRTFVALPDTAYDKVVGTSTIDSDGTTLYLGSFKIEKTDAKWSLAEVWLEAGELSRDENSEDAKGSVSITQIGGCPVAPAGYTAVNESKNNTQGFETCSRTFYKDDSELSRSNDYVGSQLAESIEVFSPTVEPAPTNVTAVLGNKSTSNVDGIPTVRYTFLVPSVLSESSDKVGSQLAITIESFNSIPATPAGYSIASTQKSDIEGIPTKRYTFLKDNVELSRSEDKVGSQLSITIEQFNGTPATPAGYLVASERVSDFEGIPTKRYTFLKPSVLSQSEDNVGSQKSITIDAFGQTPATPSGYVLANEQVSDFEGISTKRFTFLEPSILSLVQEFIGGKTIVAVEAFAKTEAEINTGIAAITSNHLLVSQVESDFDGIKTTKFNYEIDAIEVVSSPSSSLLSIQETELSINNLTRGVIGSSTKSYEGKTLYLGEETIDNNNAIKTRVRVWFEAGILSETLDNVGSQKAKVIQTIGTDPVAPSGYALANKSESDFQGFQTNKFTFLKNNSILNTSTNSISDGVVEVSTTFFGSEGTVVGPIISRTTGDVEGIPTITVKTLQDKSGQAIGGGGVNSEFQQYVNFTYPGEVSIATDQDTITDPATGNPGYIFNSYWYSLKPPVTRKVLADVSISFQNNGNLAITHPLWSPVGWAKGTVDGLGTNYTLKTLRQTAQDKAFNEYTVVEGGNNSYSGTAGFGNTPGGAVLMEGNYILPGATYSIDVSGGPGRPDGNTYTLDAQLTPAFSTADGIQYWKKTLVVATIPVR
jgi:hypothetical protein